ncbi:MAG: TRAP transporter substrate-binding protein DctP [Pseudomonadota bacterium]|nr:TRAP transporter substrate-binding protein DctP [Pseudomonadota bacterium]
MKTMHTALCAGTLVLTATVTAQAESLVQRYLNGDPEVTMSTQLDYDGPTVRIRYSTLAPGAGVSGEFFGALFGRLEADTGGKIVIDPYYSSSLADTQAGGFESVRSGLTDIGTCYMQFNPSGFDLQFGIQLPGVIPQADAGLFVYNEAYAEYFKENYELREVYLAHLGLGAPNKIYSKEPLASLADFQGQRAWANGDVASRTLEALGMEPTNVNMSDFYPAFQTGVFDVAPFHDLGAVVFRLPDIADYRTDVNLWGNPNENCMNMDFWDGLDPAVQTYLYHWFQVWGMAYTQALMVEGGDRVRENVLAEQGINFIELSDEDQAEVDAVLTGLVDEWAAERDADGEPGSELIAMMRERYEIYNALSPDERFQKVLDAPVPGLINGF